MNTGTISIRQGHNGNGHYIAFYWSFIHDGTIHNGSESTWQAALDTATAKQRLEHLRDELRAERISYDELHELQTLTAHIEPDDVELLQAAGVLEQS